MFDSETDKGAQSSVDPAQVARRLDAVIEKVDMASKKLPNVAVSDAADLILQHIEGVRALRGELVETFKKFDHSLLDLVVDYAVAAKFLYNAEQVTTEPNVVSDELAVGQSLRAKLTAVVRMHVDLETIDPRVANPIFALPNGYAGTSNALQRLEQLIQKHFAVIGPSLPFSTTVLDDARKQSAVLGAVKRSRAKADPLLTAKRRKASVLMVEAWDEIRAAVTYVRRATKDEDSIAPALAQTRSAAQESDADGSDDDGDDHNPDNNPDARVEPAKPAEPAKPLGPANPVEDVEPLPDAPFKK
jgi:hypothetical protein